MDKPILQYRTDKATYYLSGKLIFETTPVLWKESQVVFKRNSESFLTFDLGGVIQSDSSGVALLIAWKRQFQQRSKVINFVQLPNQMIVIIQLAGLEDIILIEPNNP